MPRPLFSIIWRGTNVWPVSLLALLLVMLEWLFLEYGLKYNPFQEGDVSDYWRDSLRWREPFDPFHMPGYPLAIAAVRGVAGSLLRPQAIMLGITLVSLSVAVVAVYRIVQVGPSPDKAQMGLLAVALFVLWPMVGTTYVAYPIADMFGMAPLLLGWWLLLRKRPFPAAIMLGIAIVSHKGMWPFALFLMAGHIFTVRTAASFLVAGVMVLPIAILWMLGTIHHDSPAWLFASNIDFEIRSTSFLPVLDGMVGSILFGGLSGIAKGLIVLGVALLALAVILRARLLPGDNETKWYSLAVALAVLLLVLVLNEREIWASVRFGRLLAVPLTMLYGTMVISNVTTSRRLIYGVAPALLILFFSQLAFGFYMARVWTYSP